MYFLDKITPGWIKVKPYTRGDIDTVNAIIGYQHESPFFHHPILGMIFLLNMMSINQKIPRTSINLP